MAWPFSGWSLRSDVDSVGGASANHGRCDGLYISCAIIQPSQYQVAKVARLGHVQRISLVGGLSGGTTCSFVFSQEALEAVNVSIVNLNEHKLY